LAYRIAELTNAGLDFRQLLVGIHRELDAVLNAGNFYIALYDREQALIRFPYMVDEGEAGPEPVFDTARAFGNSATEYVIRKGEPVLWNAKEIREHMAAGDIHETDEIPAAWLSVPFRNNDGQVIGVVTVQSYKDPAAYGTEDVELLAFVSGQIADAVRHARADVALAESERRYRLVAENVSDVIWTADVDGKFTYVSPSVWDLIRYEPEELEGSKLEALIGIVEPKSRATAQELLTSLEQAIEDPDGRPSEPWIATIEARAKDGLPVWTESHVSLLYNEDGNVIGLLGSTRDVTARQEAEEAMQASEERFRMLYESVQAGVLVRSNKGRIIQANQTAAEMLGLSLDELYRCSEEEFDWNAIQSDGTPVSASDLPFMHTIQTGEPVRHAVRGVFANDPNHFRWLLINTEPLTDAAGNLLEVITTFTDITPLKETQEALRRSQELLQETGRMAHVGGWEVRLPGWELVWTDEVYRIYGLDPEMPAPSLEEAVKFFAPDDQPRIMAAVEQAIAKDGSFDLELELITAQDEHRWTHAQGWGERDQHGDIKRVYGTFQDVTTRHEAEAELRRSENTLRALLNAMDAMALLVDLEGTILAANENTAAYLDVSVEQLIGSKGQRILPSEIADKLVIRAEEAIASTRPVRSEDEWGDRILAHTIYPILSSQGRVERLAIYIRDVTEEREIEAHLQQTTKMEALGRLAGGVAHDFNNLLTVMTSYSDMLLAEPEMPEPLKADITEISQAADQAASLTHQLLAFSRKQMLEPERMSLNKVVEGMETMLRRLLSEDIKLCVDLAPEMGHVKADPGQIGQVIVNLVVNARDAMPQGGRLDIRTRHVSLDADDVEMLDLTPGRYVTLIVQDTGTGIAEDVLPHIFDPFYTTKAHGTGLGLATVYGIVTQSGGDVVVETQEGAGSTFIIYLPSVDAPAITEISEAARPETGSETILLVEDEDVIRALARRILSRNGYHVLEASDAAAALERYAENDGRIDLLLTDVVMPEMDGAQLAEHLRHQHPDLPVLFMSGYTDDVLSQRGLHEENEELLSKPFTPTSLACRVRNVLDRNGQK
jgi:PAS domain S-box-containing protein